MRIAMIGMGEVGCTFFEAISANGVKVSYVADKQLTPRAKKLCEQHEALTTTDVSNAIDHVDMLMSCVEGEAAELIATTVARKGHRGQVLLDFSTASADIKKSSAKKLQAQGIDYIDVAIMGAIALTGSHTSMIAAGVSPGSAGQKSIELLKQAGLSISTIDNSQAGDAISLKLLRSIFTKGLEALTIECLATAEYLGVRHGLYDVLSDIDNTPLPEFMEMLIRTHLVHANRRGKEVQRANEQVENLGLSSIMLPAIEAVFARTQHHAQQTTTEMPNTKDALDKLITLCQIQTEKKVI